MSLGITCVLHITLECQWTKDHRITEYLQLEPPTRIIQFKTFQLILFGSILAWWWVVCEMGWGTQSDSRTRKG